MAGTRQGGIKAAQKNKELYGSEYYMNIGRKGGKASGKGGFASTVIGKDGLTGAQRARVAGSKGGTISKRGPRE